MRGIRRRGTVLGKFSLTNALSGWLIGAVSIAIARSVRAEEGISFLSRAVSDVEFPRRAPYGIGPNSDSNCHHDSGRIDLP